MGQVAITFEIMPVSPEVDLEALRSEVDSRIGGFSRIEQVEIRPIAFGLKALMMNVVVDDEEGMMDRLEETIGGIEGVQNAKVAALTKI